jgi:hypothetical protein
MLNPQGIVGKVVLSFVRHSIVGISAIYVKQGLITGDQQTTLVAGAMVAFGLAMAVYDKSQQGKGN